MGSSSPHTLSVYYCKLSSPWYTTRMEGGAEGTQIDKLPYTDDFDLIDISVQGL